jgi:serine/threonine protein kinase
MSGSLPTTLGKYQIIREIARSNDIVYEAYDSLMNRRIALKELAMPGGSTSQQKEDRIKRFLREARAAGSLAHPNIMTVYEVGQEGDRYFIAMEYLDGKTLRNELDTKGFLPPERATEIAKAVLEGLEYAHTKGVIHRDIKPDNIQLLTSGAVKVTDFGIARLTFEPNLTIDGQVFGTPSYMSPEQVVGRDIDARSDLFSVGVVLYEMLSGTKPFPGDSVVTITYSIMNRNPDRPQQINWAVWQVVEKALDKSPQLRPRSAREFIDAIDAAMTASTSQVMDPRVYNQPPPVSQPQYGQYGQTQQPQYQTPYNLPPQPTYTGYQQPAASPYSNTPGVQPPYVPGAPQQHYPNAISIPPAYGQPVPVYYPPPPRKPFVILSAQSKRLIANVIIYTLAFLAVLGLFLKGIEGVTAMLDKTPPPQSPGAKSQTPVDNLLQQGDTAVKNNDDDTAEGAFQKARDIDKNDPRPYHKLGDLFVDKANSTPDNSFKEDYLSHAADNYELAANASKDQVSIDAMSLQAAQSLYQLALMYQADGDRKHARDTLYRARTLAHHDDQEMELIEGMIQRLS